MRTRSSSSRRRCACACRLFWRSRASCSPSRSLSARLPPAGVRCCGRKRLPRSRPPHLWPSASTTAKTRTFLATPSFGALAPPPCICAGPPPPPFGQKDTFSQSPPTPAGSAPLRSVACGTGCTRSRSWSRWRPASPLSTPSAQRGRARRTMLALLVAHGSRFSPPPPSSTSQPSPAAPTRSAPSTACRCQKRRRSSSSCALAHVRPASLRLLTLPCAGNRGEAASQRRHCHPALLRLCRVLSAASAAYSGASLLPRGLALPRDCLRRCLRSR